jgi:DNA invertase Pin-like site-specific DNA recombinase
MKKKSVVLLVRVSTQIQDTQPQIEDLKRFAIQKGFNNFHIINTKESGRSDLDRKLGVNDLFEFIDKNKEFNSVIITEISRLGRRQSVLHNVKEWFVKNKVQLFVKDTGYSLFDENGRETPEGGLMFTLYGYFAESEIKQKMERFQRSKRSLMEQGYSISGKTLFGYKRILSENNRTTLISDNKNSKIVLEIFKWYLYGIDDQNKTPSIKGIVLECIKRGYPPYTHSKRNVNKLLKEDGYTGFKTTNNKRKHTNIETGEISYITTNNNIKYPTIIDLDTFLDVQKKLKSNNTNVDKSTKHITILSKLIKCPNCNRHLNGNYRIKNNLGVNSYRCTSRSGASPCDFKNSISMSMIDSVIWSLIKSDLFTLSKLILKENPDKELERLKNSKNKVKTEIKGIDEDVKSLNNSLKSIGNMKSIDLSTFLKSIEMRLSKLNKDKKVLENELSKILISLSVKEDDKKENYESINKNIGKIESSKELLKKYINLFVNEIDIILQSQRFTIIRINFKIESDTFRPFSSLYPNNPEYEILEKYTHLILDKKNTQEISVYRNLIPMTNFSNKRIKLKPKGSNSLDVLLSELSESKHFKIIDFKKLDVYQLTKT